MKHKIFPESRPDGGPDGRSNEKWLRYWANRAHENSDQSTRARGGEVKNRDTSLPPEKA